MAQTWIGTRWRAACNMRLPGVGRIGPGDEFTYTEAMEAAGCLPDQWALAGNAEFIPAGTILPDFPKDDDAPPVAADADPVAPAGRHGKRTKWTATYTEDADVAVVTEVDDASDAGA